MTLTPPADVTQEFLPDELIIRRDLLGIAMGHTYSAIAGNAAVGLLTAVLLGRMLDGKALAMSLWMVGLSAFLAVRLIHFSKIRARVAALDASGLAQAEWQTTVLIGLCGLTWGILPLISFSGAYGFTDFYTLATLLGMSSGAVNSTLALPKALRAYLLCLGGPFFVLRAFYLGGQWRSGRGLDRYLYYHFSMGVGALLLRHTAQ